MKFLNPSPLVSIVVSVLVPALVLPPLALDRIIRACVALADGDVVTCIVRVPSKHLDALLARALPAGCVVAL